MVGTTISHYRILEKLGEGGMGLVYKAEDTLLKRTVALKFLPPAFTSDPEAKERFINEAQAASALEHANICSVHEIADHEGQTFIVMGYYEGETLKKKIEEERLAIEDGIDIGVQIAQGLARAHEAGIIHRDIKPANIMVTSHGEVKILDFGLARMSGRSRLTKTGVTLGTAAYMSPEQARGEQVDQRTDIWSLGVVLFEMLTGQLPFKSEHEQAIVYAILNENPTPPRTLRPEVPEIVELIVLKALAKAPGDRYQRAGDFLADLKSARAPEQTGATIAATEALASKRIKRLRRNLLLAGLAAVLFVVGLLVILPPTQDEALAAHPRVIAFISLENRTGDPSLEYLRSVLPDVLGATLADSRYLRVTRSDRMRALMKQIGRDTVEYIDRETGLLLCRRAGIDVMGVGSYTKAGPMFLAELELIDVNTGERLGSALKGRGNGVESFLKDDGIVEDLARQLSREIGVSQAGSQASVKTVAEVSSSSPEAQMYLLRGKREIWEQNSFEARRYFELAVKQDSTFALAWYYLSTTPTPISREKEARKFALAQAVKYASRATEREKFDIASADLGLRASLLKDLGREESGRDWESWLRVRTEIFPFDAEFRFWYGFQLAKSGKVTEGIAELERTLQLDPAFAQAYNTLGYCYVVKGEGEKAIQVLERYIKLQPGNRDPLSSMAECLLILGRYDEAIVKGENAVQISPEMAYDRLVMARLCFMKEDYEGALSWTVRPSKAGSGETERPDFFSLHDYFYWHAYYLIWSGRLREAEETLKESEQKATLEYRNRTLDEASKNSVLWNISYLRAWCAYEKGNCREARRQLSELARLGGRLSPPQLYIGLVDLEEGKIDSIQMRQKVIEDSIQAWSQRDSANSRYYEEVGRSARNALEGAYLLASGRPAEIRPNWTPRVNAQIPDSVTTACWPLFTPWKGMLPGDTKWIPVPFDILPRAYVKRGMIDSAIASYELALKKPPHWLGPIIPRYYYRVARLYEQKGMKEKAIENYTQFLRVWSKADPIYRDPADARARLARLKRGFTNDRTRATR